MEGGFGSEAFGAMRCLVTRANRQPAVACSVRRPGDAAFAPLAMDVLHIEDGLVRDIVTFDADHFDRFDLPASLPAQRPGRTGGTPARAGVPPRSQRVKLKSAVRATPSPRSSRSVLHEPA